LVVLDSEVKERIAAASSSFGRLNEKFWSNRDLTINTKLSVFEACVMLTLLYASETWTTYQRHVNTLERFHQQCLRQILGIKWQSHTPDTDVLATSGSTTVAARLMRNQMRWAGHLVRMEDTRIPKQLFFGELRDGSRPQHKPKKRFRDSVNLNLKRMQVPLKNFEAECADRSKWRNSVYVGAKRLEDDTVAQAKLRRACRKHEAVPATQWNCDICGRVLLSKAGLVNHLKSHQPRETMTIPLPAAPTVSVATPSLSCTVCGKTCKSAGGLKLHMKVHGGVIPTASAPISPLSCHLCHKQCKSLAGLKSHLRAHGRSEQTDVDGSKEWHASDKMEQSRCMYVCMYRCDFEIQ